MFNKNLPVVKRRVRNGLYKAKEISKIGWVRLVALGLFLLLLSQKEFSFELQMGDARAAITTIDMTTRGGRMEQPLSLLTAEEEPIVEEASSAAAAEKVNQAPSSQPWWEQIRDEGVKLQPVAVQTAAEADELQALNLANAATAVSSALTEEQKQRAAKFSNLGFFLSPGYAERHKIAPEIVAYKKQVCLNYIAQYAKTAQEEARLFNIPASITLAQGLLESNAGASNLAKRDNNHFGIKCRKKCVGCRCANYTDDSRYDMFRIYDSAWESFRSHSKLLKGKRYAHLLKLDRSNYKDWAHGLKAAGYATDKRYAEKLIKIIEAFDLVRFDLEIQ